MHLSGKVALITGGRRIGRHLAHTLAGCGTHIAVSYFTSRDIALATVAECVAMGVESDAFFADLRDPQQAQDLVNSIVARWGRLEILANLTSVYRRTPWTSLTPDDYHQALAANLTAPYWVALAAARQMQTQPLEQGLQGKILHCTDWAVDRPYRDFLPYLIAKGGLVTLTRALAVELAPTITVNAIAPGTVEPPPHLTPAQVDQIRQSTLLARPGSAADLSAAALYLLRDTDFVTGEVYRVDGGRFLGPAS